MKDSTIIRGKKRPSKTIGQTIKEFKGEQCIFELNTRYYDRELWRHLARIEEST